MAAQLLLHRLRTKATVVVQLDDAADRRELRSAAALDLRWVNSADELVATLRALPRPAGEGFAWAAGEASAMARLRQVLAEEQGLPKEVMRVSAYWKQGAADFHEPGGH